MSELLKYAGLFLIAIAALLLCRRYGAYAERRVAETRGFLNLLRHVRGRIASFLEPLPRAVRGFSDGALESLGFLTRLREGEALPEAYLAVMGKCSLSKEVRRLLEDTLCALGRGTRDETVSYVDGRISELSELLAAEEVELERSVKLTRTLICAAALGIVILFI